MGTHAKWNTKGMAMIINQILELKQGGYQIKANITENEAMYLFGVAFTTLLVTGGVAFTQEMLGEDGSITSISAASKDKH